MSALKYIERLQRMDYFIRIRNTGSPSEFAAKIGISERSLYDYLNTLKALGAPIAFSYHDNSYIYIKDGRLKINFLLNDPAYNYHDKGQGAEHQVSAFLYNFNLELIQLQKYCSYRVYF